MRLSIIASLLFSYSISIAQISNYQNLLDTALNGHGVLFVVSHPLKIIRLDQSDMREYAEYLKEEADQDLDTVMFSQIIYNSKLADTTLWTDKELPNAFLVNERDGTVSKKYALRKAGPVDERKRKFYKKQISKFNSTIAMDRNLYYFSRPVFDNSKTSAIVQWDNGYSYLGGGSRIILYQLQKDKTWSMVGIINNWKY